MEALPDWKAGTPAILCTAGPHAIPVSTALRAGERRILLALGRRRETLRLLRDEPRVAFCLLGAGVAFSAYGDASVLREELDSAPHVAAVAVEVTSIDDHLEESRTEMIDGARWRFTASEAEDDARRIDAELRSLA
jgi:hypothetical protein